MSIRQRLKKEIYQGNKEGIDVSNLEKRLKEMELTPQQKIHQREASLNTLFLAIERHKRSAFILAEDVSEKDILRKYQSEIDRLESEIKTIRRSISKDSWSLPYFVRKKINSFYMGKGNEIERLLLSEKPDKIELIEMSKKTRYLVLSINGIYKRFNLLTKQEFINRNWYWFQHKTCSKTYTNCLLLKMG